MLAKGQLDDSISCSLCHRVQAQHSQGRTLAVVRKLAVPVLQVNIAKRQVNVAGQCLAAD
jgi:hypothetical protein